MNHGRTDGCTDGQRHGRTTRKHIASAGSYRRRSLNKTLKHFTTFLQMFYFICKYGLTPKMGKNRVHVWAHFLSEPHAVLWLDIWTYDKSASSLLVTRCYLPLKCHLASPYCFWVGVDVWPTDRQTDGTIPNAASYEHDIHNMWGVQKINSHVFNEPPCRTTSAALQHASTMPLLTQNLKQHAALHGVIIQCETLVPVSS